MVRGWESKFVDDPIADAAARPGRAVAGGGDASAESRATSLKRARARALQDLQLACDRRHRASLERTIEHLDTELAGLR
jgi:hypothetical protein